MRLGLRSLTIILTASLIGGTGFLSAGTIAAAPSLGLSPAAWTSTYEGKLKYPKVAVTYSVPIKMSDGTILRGDVYRPADLSGHAVEEKNPVIVNVSPYNKLVPALLDIVLHIPGLTQPVLNFINSLNFSRTPFSNIEQLKDSWIKGKFFNVFGVDRRLVRSGYTQITVDVRGTGTSQGKWLVFNRTEQQDTIEILQWARKQKYSNGKLGMSGVSYSAINQLQAAAKRPVGLDALFAVEPMTDIVPDIVAPGGGLGLGFLALWLTLVNSLKFIPDLPSLLRGKFDVNWLQSRVTNPAVMVQQIIEAISVPLINKMSPSTKALGAANSKIREDYKTDAAKIITPTFVIGGWHDIFQNSEWRALDQLSGLTRDKKKLMMGNGYHITGGGDMGDSNEPPHISVLQRAWFDKWLKGIDNGIDNYSPATINQLNGGWVQAEKFPLPGQEYRRMYLTSSRSGTARTAVKDGSLSLQPPKGKTDWKIAPGLNTLCSNDTVRDSTGLLVPLDICVDDNRIAERNALTFTSAAAEVNTQISGPINIHLNTKTDTRDGFYSAVITDVAPNGKSRVLSTGNMTTSVNGQLVPLKSGYAPNGDLVDPYYALDIVSRRAVKPGSVVMLEIGALATSAVLKKGHRLRVSIYALNLSRGAPFGPVSKDSGLKPEHIIIDPMAPSWVNIPSNKSIG